MKKLELTKPVLNKIVYVTVSVSLLLLIFLLTDPNQISLAVLLVPFMLVGVAVYNLTGLVMDIRIKPAGLLARLVPLTVAFMVVTLLLLASLGQLTIRDSLLVIGFVGVFLLYANRADFLK